MSLFGKFQIKYWMPSYGANKYSLGREVGEDSVSSVSGSRTVESEPPDEDPVIVLEGLTKVSNLLKSRKYVITSRVKFFCGG